MDCIQSALKVAVASWDRGGRYFAVNCSQSSHCRRNTYFAGHRGRLGSQGGADGEQEGMSVLEVACLFGQEQSDGIEKTQLEEQGLCGGWVVASGPSRGA